MTRVTPILIVTIFLTSFLMVPTVFVFGGSNALANIDATPESQALISQMPHNARVAIYDEDNLTVPVISHASDLTNNISEVTAILEGAGHSVEALTEGDILNHELITADYDVFIIVNNVPRPSIEHLIKEFWLGGGGLLTFNSAVSYLWYGGYIFADQDYDVGYGIWWGYWSSDSQNITSRHSTMKDYHVNDTVYERAENWATSWEPKLIEARGNDMIFLMNNASSTDFITAFAIDNHKDGGRIVQLPNDGYSIPADFESIIIDSVEWLVPKPKGRIVFDLSHQPRIGIDPWDAGLITVWTPVNSYTQFRTLAVNHSYTFDKLYPSASGNLTAERLAKYDVLIINWPDLDYTSAERAAVEAWIAGGGSLLALGDRTGMSGGDSGDVFINQLIQNFDMSLGTTDVLDFQTMTPGTHVTLEGCAGLYIGYRNYLVVIGDATPIWFDGTDVVVAGQEFGEGRAILSADMNIFDNSELPEDDNVRYAINALNWLTAADAEILAFSSYGDDVMTALRDLGLPYQPFYRDDYLDDFIDSKEWGLVILDQSNLWFTTQELDTINTYVSSGGRLVMSYFDVGGSSTHPLWSELGFEYSNNLIGEPDLFIWDSTHEIFSLPNDLDVTFKSNILFGDDGDNLFVLEGFSTLAGNQSTYQNGSALIVLKDDYQTLYNGYLIDTCTGDEDDSTYRDSVELWQNEIAFMQRPTIDSPADFNFTAGTPDMEILWHADSYSPDHYEILQNGTSVASGEWNGSEIVFSLDGVTAGAYEYQVTVYDVTGNNAIDAVIVTVLPGGIFGALDPMLLLGIGIAAFAVIIVVAFVLRRRSAGGASKPKPKKKKTTKKKK